MKSVKLFIRKYPFSLICIVLIWYLCVLFDVPETSLQKIKFFDKWTHFIMYGGLCSVIWWEYLRHHDQLDTVKLLLWALAAPVVMSGIIELVQAYCTVNRNGDWYDLMANSVGVLLGNGIGLLMKRILKRVG